MLRDSWKIPSLVAPSPMKAAATRLCPRILNERAMPVAMGSPPPTMATAGTIPLARSPMCMDPPLPLQQPVTLPKSSAIMQATSSPLAMQCPCGRCVEVMTSSAFSAAHTPTAEASWPWLWWMVPGIAPSRNRNFTRSSNSRMRTILRYRPCSHAVSYDCSFTRGLRSPVSASPAQENARPQPR